MNKQDEFVQAFTAHIGRDGCQELLAWLMSTDFFIAPASTKFHGSYEGGLMEHSLNVFYRLKKLWADEYGADSLTEKQLQSLAVCGLLHDVCKANFYKVSSRNVKNDQTGAWEKKPYYTVEDQFPYGHGEKSVYIIGCYMKLTRDEALAIRWHMGGFDDAAKGFSMSKAYESNPLALLLHMADMMATYLDEGSDTATKQSNGEG